MRRPPPQILIISTLVTHGGLPDVDHSLPYFCPVGRAIGRGACWDESGAVLAALGPDFWSVSAQSRGRLPRAGRRRSPGRGRAPLWCGVGVWTLGHPDPHTGVAPSGPAGRLLAGASL